MRTSVCTQSRFRDCSIEPGSGCGPGRPIGVKCLSAIYILRKQSPGGQPRIIGDAQCAITCGTVLALPLCQWQQ
jgi:hypothetical protein